MRGRGQRRQTQGRRTDICHGAALPDVATWLALLHFAQPPLIIPVKGTQPTAAALTAGLGRSNEMRCKSTLQIAKEQMLIIITTPRTSAETHDHAGCTTQGTHPASPVSCPVGPALSTPCLPDSCFSCIPPARLGLDG